MNVFRFFFIVFLMFTISISSVYAITSTIVNKTNNAITVLFRAVGCGKVSHGQTLVCKSKSIKPGESVSYSWKWLQSSRSVKIKDGKKMYDVSKRIDVPGKAGHVRQLLRLDDNERVYWFTETKERYDGKQWGRRSI